MGGTETTLVSPTVAHVVGLLTLSIFRPALTVARPGGDATRMTLAGGSKTTLVSPTAAGIKQITASGMPAHIGGLISPQVKIK